jgi:MFS family permease
VIFSTDLFLIISISCMMALVYATLPISDTLLARNIPNHLRSRIFALIYLISFSASALAVPTIAILHLRDGFTTLFITLSILAFILALIITKLPEK